MYIDVNFKYKDPLNKLLLSDIEVLNQSITNLFNTPKGSRFFNRRYGTNLQSLVFENINDNLLDIISVIIFQEIREFEPRVTINSLSDVDISFDYNNKIIIISVKYYISNLEGVVANFNAKVNV